MPPKFFITHSWKDMEFARKLTDDLRAHGLDGFFDAYSIKPGDMIPKELQRGLEACDIYVPILSEAALASPWCDEELNAALALSNASGRNGRPRIIPLLIQDCLDKLPPFLRARLYILFNGRYDDALKELLSTGFGVSVLLPPALSPSHTTSSSVPVLPEEPTHCSKLLRFRSDAWYLPDEELLGFVEIPAGPLPDKQTDFAPAYDSGCHYR